MTILDKITLEDIQAAAQQIAGAVIRTPCSYSRTLSQMTGAEIWVKFENLQFTASFKERGALHKLLSLSQAERQNGVIAMSAGNHAQGVAYHAGRLGIPATIVMPVSTPYVKVKYTEGHGARVILTGETLAESQIAAEEMAKAETLVLVHPYDDPLILAGQGTIALEMLADVPDLEMLVIPVGGGGLMSGNAIAAKAISPAIALIGVQTTRYPSVYAALRGEVAECRQETLAEGIAVKNLGKITLPIMRELVSEILLVDEPEIEQAVSLYAMVEKTIAEGAGAAGLAAVLRYPEKFRGRKVGLVLCGGNIDARLLAQVLLREQVREGRIISLRVEIADRPGMLAKVAGIIGAEGGSIIEVLHQRLFTDVPAKSTDLDLTVETRGRNHANEIRQRLIEAGFRLRELPGHS